MTGDTMLYSIGYVRTALFWWNDVETNEGHPARSTILAGECVTLYPPVAYQRIIKIDAKNKRYLLQAKCGGMNWFAWAKFDEVEQRKQNNA